ncbi:NAD(P)-dependent alcohol dehydrogenase [Neorhizobium galegae]|uniref:zinc-dependent alcohol dehydrogenase family protein n=1 Tax=Neorhizobium galegae TaxID=399 RepID=UPI00062276CF|nr:NAD(P)-dependent alcohol dehydrogenase [Neorhizobium galegae]CDZ30918.1 Oxidoreductase, zinc-binding dehydrogenase family [Neorhizobium galegae bv. officinalis]MCQ1769060.1 NAD(P)-dependent alcohol dehydrogenase [Neorhizobium galegae]MCQ1781161.1 NAD(P)-dependent alcohol dehydrogenase [Neorhizobium galegae]MCQ1799376.1 NAD(P)-dependent alcohol dehydrogenase [Neorhizobium galegae]MCQ1846225.1 NAD(P)-dependent alcohol dehydrogenase [Neorhizobium galegae]
MKVYRHTQLGDMSTLKVREEALRSVGFGQVLVRVQASSLNFRDLIIAQGHYPFGIVENHVPLSDGAGVIEAVGDGVRRFAVGDRVMSSFFPDWFGGPIPAHREQYQNEHDGWLTEYRLTSAEALTTVPDHLTFEEASALPCAALTGWSAVSGVGPGDTVLTLGTGGVSLSAIQFAKALGARVIATTSSSDKFEKLTALGADALINYRETPDWHRAVRDLTGGLGADRIVEVGGPATIAQSVRSIREGGQVSIVGALGMKGEAIDIMKLFFSQATYKVISVGNRSDLEEMNRAVAAHQIRPVIDSVFAFEDAHSAYERLGSRNVFGKVVIRN